MRGMWISMGLMIALGLATGCGGGSKGGAACEPACAGATPYCDPTSNRCVACLTDEDCAGDTVCGVQGGAPACVKGCVPGAVGDAECTDRGDGTTCCDRHCIDAQNDPGNCGGCGTVCPTPTNGRAACEAGQCGLDACNPGYKDCDQDLSNGCEAHTDGDPQNCGACGQVCPGLANGHATCSGGTCTVACDLDYMLCDGACIDTSSDLQNCGACGRACTGPAHASVACTNGTCATTCDPHYTLCGGVCIDTQSDPENCGGCGHVCSGVIPYCDRGTCAASPTVLQVAAGDEHTCALLGDSVYCWGLNDAGQLGLGSYDTDVHLKPTEVPGLSGVTQLAAGRHHTCVRLGDGTVQCWGLDDKGQLGYTATSTCTGSVACSTSPRVVTGLGVVTQLTGGGGHTCALLSGGSARCWGDNYYGQLGDGSYDGSGGPHPTPVAVSLSGITQLAAGGDFTCALLGDGSVFCWGASRNGQIGDGSMPNTGCSYSDGSSTTRYSCIPRPTKIPGFTSTTQLAAGEGHACARTEDSRAFCWGYNANGQIGKGGSNDNSISPTLVNGLRDVVEVDAGGSHTCARLSSGRVSCWGANSYGQLGDGTTTQRALFVSVSGMFTAVRLSLGGNHTCAQLGDGTLGCWGENGYGQLGYVSPSACTGSNTACSLSPMPVVW